MTILNGVYCTLRKRFRKLRHLIRIALKDFKITPEQVMILEAIDENEAITVTEIGRLLGLEYTTVIRGLERLRKKKYIFGVPYKKSNNTHSYNEYIISTRGSNLLLKVYNLFRDSEKKFLDAESKNSQEEESEEG